MLSKKNDRLLLAVGNKEIEDQIKMLPNVTVIDSDPDVEIITDIMNYETVDFVILNTVLSEGKSLILAKKAKEKSVNVIAILRDYRDRDFVAALVGLGVKAFASFDELQKVSGYINEYPEEFDFNRLQKAGANGQPFSESQCNINLKGKIFIGVFNICSGAGATTTSVEIAENIANSGYRAICISPGSRSDFQFINRKKCKAEYLMIKEEDLTKELDRIYSESEHTVILFDFGKVFDIDSEGNLNEVLQGKEIYREFMRCGYKVGLAFSDPWHEGKLKFFQDQQISGDLTILLSGFGIEDAVKSYPELRFYNRDKLADFIDEMKSHLGMTRSNPGKRWRSRFSLRLPAK